MWPRGRGHFDSASDAQYLGFRMGRYYEELYRFADFPGLARIVTADNLVRMFVSKHTGM